MGEDKMMVRILVNCILMTGFLTSFGCTLKTVDTTETGDKDARKTWVLIATQKSKFKRSVVSEIKDTLADNVYYIKVVDVKWLPNESVGDYSAIVLISRCMAGRPDPRVESFIDNVQDKSKVIILTTGRMDSWRPDSAAVDAMTSASIMSETTQISQKISSKVLTIINSQ